MRCPYCRTPLAEKSPECPSCKLTLSRVNGLLGPIPRLNEDVSDLLNLLPAADLKKVHKAIARLKWAFPQVQPHVLIHNFPADHPFELHVFWIFNGGGISIESARGGDNHTILLVLDPNQRRSALMVGYGLEPFIDDASIDQALEKSDAAWRANQWTRGILDAFEGIDQLLERAASNAAEAFGLTAVAPSAKSADF